MAHVDYTQARPGDARDPTAYNSALTDVETETAALDETNLAEQGLARDHFATPVRPAYQAWTPLTETARASTPLNDVSGVWQTATGLTWTGATTTFRTGAVSLLANEKLLIRWGVFFSTVLTGPTFGIPDTGEFRGRIAYFPNGGAHTPIGNSVRRLAIVGDTVNWPNFGGNHGWCGGFAYYEAASPITIDWVQIDWWTNGGGNNYHPTNGFLSGWVYRRVT